MAPLSAVAAPVLKVGHYRLVETCPNSRIAGALGRAAKRVEFPYRMQLVPLLKEERQDPNDRVEVLGKNISTVGFCFRHSMLLSHKYYRLTAADPRLERLGLSELEFVLVAKWRRFVEPGNYEIGGRIAWPFDGSTGVSDAVGA